MANKWNNIDEWIKSDPNLRKMLQGNHIQERWDLMKGTKTASQNNAWARATQDIKGEMSAIHQIGNIISSLNGMGFGYDITKKGNGNYSINFYPGNDHSFKGKVPSIEFGVAGAGTTGKMGVIIKNNIPSMNALSGMINAKGEFQLVTALERGLYDVAKRLGQKGDIKHLTGTKYSDAEKASYLQWLISNTIAEANSASPNVATSRQKYENAKTMSINERSLEGIGQVSGVVSMKGFQQDLLREYRKVFKDSEKTVVRALDDIAKLRMGIADDQKFAAAVARKFPEITNSGAWGKINTFMGGLRALGIRQGSVSENASGQIGLFGVAQPFAQFEQIHSKKSKQNSAWLQLQPHKHGQQRHAAHRGQIFSTAEQTAMGINSQAALRDIYKIADVSEKNITAAYNKLLQKYKVGQKGGMSEANFRKKFGNNIGGINLGGLLLSASTKGDFDAIQQRSATTTRKALDYQISQGLSNADALRKLFGIKRGERFTYSEDKDTGLLTADITKVLKSPIFKLMTPSGALRGVAQHVSNDELMIEILRAAGYKDSQILDSHGNLKIQGIQQRTDSYKAKHLYELVGDQMNYIAAEYINNIIGGKTGPNADAARTQAKQQFVDEFMKYMTQNKYLGKNSRDFLTWNGSDIIVSNKDVKNKAWFLQGLGAFAASKGYYDVNPFSIGHNDKGERVLNISQNLIRGRQIARTSNSVEAGAHGVKWGYREMEGVQRRLGMMRWAGHGAEADILQKYYEELFKNTELSQTEYNKMRAEETRILQNSRNAKLDRTNAKGRVITMNDLAGLALHMEPDALSGQLKDISKTAAGFIATLQAEGKDVYLDPGMIFGGKNAKGEMWNGRLIQLPNISFSEGKNDAGETIYKASSAERLGAINNLLRKVDNTLTEEGVSDTDRMIRIGDVVEEMFESIREDLYSKDFDNNSYQKAHRIKMETAGMEMTVASNFNPQNGPYADKTTNAIILNSRDFRRRLGKNVDKLSAQYEDLYGVEPKIDNLTEQEQILFLQNAIIKASTVGSAEFAATGERGIIGSGNRWPSSGGRDARAFRMLVAANDKDIAEHTMYIDPALQMTIHGDNDSDKIAEFYDFASNLAAKGYSKDQMKKLLAARRAEADFEALETQYMRQINGGKIANGEDAGSSILKLSELKNLNNKEQQEVELFYTKYGKKFTGIFSSIFQGFTQAMLGGNLDEATILSGDDTASKKNAVAAMLVRSLFRAPTENAISAKKAAEMLTLGGTQGWYNKLDELQKLMTTASTYSSKEGMQYLLDQMQAVGILDDDNGNILKSGGDNYLNQIIGQLLTTPDGAAILAEFAGAKDVDKFVAGLKSGNIHVTKDMLLSGLMHINSSMGGVGGKGVSVNGTVVHGLSDVADNIYKFIPGYGRNLEYYNNPAYTDLAEEKIKQIQNLADALGVAEDASKREADAERAKIGIANSEAAAIDKLAKEYDKLQNNVSNSADAYAEFEKKRYASPHTLLETALPYVAKGKVDTSGFTSRLNGPSLDPYLGYTEQEFFKYRDKALSSIIGTYSTSVSDLLAKNSKYGVHTLDELLAKAQDEKNSELINDIVRIRGDFATKVDRLFPDKNAEERKNYVDLVTAAGQGFYSNIGSRIINAGTDSFATEVGLGRFDLQTNGKYRSLLVDKGFADAVITTMESIPDKTSGYNEATHSYNNTVDAHIIEILDNKLSSLDAPIASWALQIMDYVQMLKDAANYIKDNKITSKEALAQSSFGRALEKEGRLQFVLDKFDALSDPNLQFRATNAIANVNPQSKYYGTVRNFSLDEAVMLGKDPRANAIYQKFRKGESITEEEQAYLEGRYSLNTNYSSGPFAILPTNPQPKVTTGGSKSRKTSVDFAAYKEMARKYSGSAQQIAKLEGNMSKMSPSQRALYQEYLTDLYSQRDQYQQSLPKLYKGLTKEDAKLADDYNKNLDLTLKKIFTEQEAGAEKKSIFARLSDGIKMSIQRMFSFGHVGMRIVSKVTQSFQKIIGYAQQLDQAMVNIQIVTGKTRDEAFNLMGTYNQLAKTLGSTTMEVANSANVWLRQGYSVNKVNELITSSLYLSKLGMLDTSTAAKDLTGIIKGFKLEVSEATNVVSKLTMIDQNAAVSAGNIATAMQQVNASAQQAGLSLDTTMGYISTIADVSQRDPSSVGASLRTIISRYGTVKAGAFAGMGVDNTGDDLENINDIEKVLRRLGISIRTSTMEFRALDDVLDEVANHWMEYSSVERNAIATAFAGTRQRESFLVLLSNMDKARKLTKVAAESQGMAELKYQAYMESSEAATKRLQNAWEGLTNTFRASDLLKGFKDTISWFVENLATIVSLLGSVGLAMKSMRTVSAIQNAMAASGTGFFRAVGTNIKDRITGLGKSVQGYTMGEGLQYLPRMSSYLQDIVNTTREIAGKKPMPGTKKAGGTQGSGQVQKIKVGGQSYNAFTSSSGRQAAIGADGQWHYIKKDGTLYKNAVGKAEAEKLDAQQQASKLYAKGGTFGQRAAKGAIAGITAGFAQGVATGKSFKNSDGEEASDKAKIAVGVSTGLTTAVTTGLLSAIPYVGPVLGPTLGPILGGLFGTYIAPLLGNLIDQQAIARRERSRDAEKTYTTIKSIEGDTKSLKELSKENWDYEDYQKANTNLNNVFTQLYGNTNAARTLYKEVYGTDAAGLSDIEIVSTLKSWLTTQYLNGSESTRKEVISQWEKALYTAEVQAYERSQEDAYYKNRTLLNTSTLKGWQGVKGSVEDFVKQNSDVAIIEGNELKLLGTSVDERLSGERQLLEYLQDQGLETTSFYKSLQKTIADTSTAFSGMTSSVEEANTKQTMAAAIAANLGNFSSSQIKRMGIDEVAELILAQVNAAGGFRNLDQTKQQYYWTGSLESLAPTARQYIESYIKNDATLYGILSGQSYTLGEVNQGLLTDKRAEEYKLSFAKQLNMTLEELNANFEIYSSFSLGDVMKGYSEVKSALEEIDSLITNITSSSGLTADNLATLLSKYPDLVEEAQSTEGLAKSLFEKTLGYLEIQRNNLLEDLGNNTTVFDTWKQSLSSEIQQALDSVGGLGNLSNGASFWEAWLNLSKEDQEALGDTYEDIQDSFTKYFNSFSWNVNIDTTILDKWRSYLSKVYDLQIENLTAQKSAMENITSQREYENKLIEARNKLENAQNEKRQVYREGVGFVYEADQEAVQEAQKELDELANEKVIDQLDMTITELQSQKKWLDEFDSRNEFQNLKQSFEGVGDDIEKILGTKDTGLWGTVNSLLNLYQKVNHISSEDFTADIAYQNTKNKQEALDLFGTYQSEIGAYQTIENALNAYRMGKIDQQAVKDIITGVGTTTNSPAIKQYASELLSGLDEAEWAPESVISAVKNTTDQRKTSMRNASTVASKLKSDYKETGGAISRYTSPEFLSNLDTSSTGEESKPRLAEREKQAAKTTAFSEILKRLGQTSFGGFHRIRSVEGDQDWLIGLNSGTGLASSWKGQLLAALYDYFNQVPYYVDLSAFDDSSDGYSDLKNEIESITRSGDTLAFPREDRNIIKRNGIPTEGELQFTPDADSIKILQRIWPKNLPGDFKKGALLDYWLPNSTVVGGLEMIGYWDLDKLLNTIFDNPYLVPAASSIAELSNAAGSLYTRAGLSSISEVGPELFATPGLSGTALIPEGSKVIPADATKGLWQLGSLASQFIKPLQSMLGGYSSDARSFLSTDESTNIQTLYVTLKADKDFDAEKFVQQLKMLQAISKHNNI